MAALQVTRDGFLEKLWLAYEYTSQREGVQYASLHHVVIKCAGSLVVDFNTVVRAIRVTYPLCVRGDTNYEMALEVDHTPYEEAKWGSIPIVVDGVERWCIAMTKKEELT